LIASAADMHRWTDTDGRVHFGDHPPPEAKTRVIEVRINTYATPSIEGLAVMVGDRKKAKKKEDSKVVIYSTTWCGVCRHAKQHFEKNNVSFTEYDVEESERGERDFARLGGSGVPVILVGKKRLNGFSAAAFEQIYSSL